MMPCSVRACFGYDSVYYEHVNKNWDASAVGNKVIVIANGNALSVVGL